MRNQWLMIWSVWLILLGVCLICINDVEVEKEVNSQYCEMVRIWKNTNGDAGWPDYNGNYDQLCLGKSHEIH